MNTSPFQPMNPLRFLAVAALFASLASLPARAGDDPDPQKLAQEMTAAYRAGQYDKALTLGEKLQKLEDDNPTHMYNLACLNCLLGKKEKAYDWLDKAVDAGWKDADQLSDDADFKTIRGEDRFRAIVRKLRDADAPKKGEKKADKKKPAKSDDDADDDDDEDDEDHAVKKPAKVEKKSPTKKEAKDDDEDDDDDAADKSEQVQELTQQLIAAAEAKDYDKALKIALKAQKIADVGLTNYNVACMYSLKGNKDKAFEYLERAIMKRDFPQSIIDQVEGDSDLDNIRKDPRYAKMMELAKKGNEKPAARGARNDDRGKKVKFEWKVNLPKGRDSAEGAPLIVVLHGFGSNMDEATQTWKKAVGKAGAVLLCPQGTMKVSDTGFQWGGDMDTVEENVMKAIDTVAREHKIDKSKIILAGFSQGAAATWALALRNPDTFCGIIPVAGRCDVKSESFFDDADLAKLRVYTILGADDKADMLKSAKDTAKKLEKKGAKVKVAEFDDLGHAYPDDTDVELGKALKFVMGD